MDKQELESLSKLEIKSILRLKINLYIKESQIPDTIQLLDEVFRRWESIIYVLSKS